MGVYSLGHLVLALFITPPAQLSSPGSRFLCSNDRLCAHEENKNPIVIVGNTNEALAAAMVLCARDVLSNSSRKLEERRSPVPPAQLVAFFNNQPPDQGSNQQQRRLSSETISSMQNALLFLGPSMGDYEHTLANALQLMSRISKTHATGLGDPMLHTSIDFGCKDCSQTMQSLSITRNRFSFLGLNLKTNVPMPDEGKFQLSRESADEWGNKLHALLDGQESSAAVTMDVRTHLALLQANSIPKTRGVLGKNDVWAVADTIQDGLHVDNGGGMLLEYQYDYSDPFGGCDPLLRPSTGYIVPSPFPSSSCTVEAQIAANDAYAASYSTMVGSGMDPVSSNCIATSVKAIFRELGKTDSDGFFSPPPYAWNVIDNISECSLQGRQTMRQEDGIPRKMYKDFGYR